MTNPTQTIEWRENKLIVEWIKYVKWGITREAMFKDAIELHLHNNLHD